MRHPHTLLLLTLVLFLTPCTLIGQVRQNSTYQAYISQYAPVAQDQMNRHGIPASITLAQGLLESGAGTSTLATKANNHFGIKVTSDWTGPYILRDDDKPNEKFRVYKSAGESYEDHSLFLKRSRYQSLFSLDRTDYKGWAHGLKKCGYATSPTYAENLINIIELYNLAIYDGANGRKYDGVANTSQSYSINPQAEVVGPKTSVSSIYDIIRFCNKSRYIIAQEGDTWKSVGHIYGKRSKQLRRYNEYPKGEQPEVGKPIYLQSKRKFAARSLRKQYHEVKSGESMHSISQHYGVKVKTLYQVNKMRQGTNVTVGERIRIR